MLRCPTNAPDDLIILFEFQLSNLDTIRRHDAAAETSSNKVPSYVTEIIRTPPGGSEANLIATHLGPKYVIPPEAADLVKPPVGKSRSGGRRVIRSRDDHPSVTRPTNDNKAPPNRPSGQIFLNVGSGRFSLMTSPDVSVGSFYDPRLLPDFGGPLFRLVHAKLLQRNVVDAHGELVPPWETYDKLRPGTLVLIKAQLMTYEIEEQKRDGYKKV